MKLPELKIGNKIAKVPIIQGGMAVRLSTARIAAAVANEGGIGLIAASGMPTDELRYEIRLARSLTSGIIGINIMVAARGFSEIVKTAIEEGIDLVVAGAGFSRDMFGLGQEAGGHLGTSTSIRELIPDIAKAVDIPVVAAGGVLSGQDIVDLIKMGASGVQMGSRFAASEESNAAPALKRFYLKSKPDDIVVIHSPVGLPGRAVRNPFADKIMVGPVPPKGCKACLKSCKHNFCIIDSLIRAEQGDVENGLVFTGEYIHRIKEILPVREIISRIKSEVAAID